MKASIPYRVVFIHRDGLNVTERVVVDDERGLPYEDTYERAKALADALNRSLEQRGEPGRHFAMLARDLTDEEIASLDPAVHAATTLSRTALVDAAKEARELNA